MQVCELFERVVPMQLDTCQTHPRRNLANSFRFKIDEHPHLLNLCGQLLDNLPGCLCIDSSWTRLVKYKTHCFRSRIDSSQRVFQVRYAADLDPSHDRIADTSLEIGPADFDSRRAFSDSPG